MNRTPDWLRALHSGYHLGRAHVRKHATRLSKAVGEKIGEKIVPRVETAVVDVTPHPLAAKLGLYHKPVNVNEAHKAAYQSGSFNDRIAFKLSDLVSTMWCTYIFAVLATITLVGVAGAYGHWSAIVVAIGEGVSQTFIQLVFLPVLSVTSKVEGQRNQMLADEQFKTTETTYAALMAQDQQILDLVQINKQQLAQLQAQAAHLDAQDAQIATQGTQIAELLAARSRTKKTIAEVVTVAAPAQ